MTSKECLVAFPEAKFQQSFAAPSCSLCNVLHLEGVCMLARSYRRFKVPRVVHHSSSGEESGSRIVVGSFSGTLRGRDAVGYFHSRRSVIRWLSHPGIRDTLDHYDPANARLLEHVYFRVSYVPRSCAYRLYGHVLQVIGLLLYLMTAFPSAFTGIQVS